MIYLDHNATAPLRPQARDAMEIALGIGANPSSVHARGRAAHAVVERARAQVAALAGARIEDVVFTSGGSEANALALHGAIHGAADQGARITRLFVSAMEHESVLANAAALAERMAGLRLEIVAVTRDGVVDLESLRTLLREGKGRTLVALMAANNETGVVQPIAEAAEMTREAGALLFVDGVQAAGKIALPSADYVSLSAHKIGGPQGAGALILRQGAPFAAQILGGGQEFGRRAGTENLSGIAGFGAASEIAARELPHAGRMAAMRDRFEDGLKRVAPDAVVFGGPVARLANTSNFALPGLPAETALMALDADGVMLSSGAACSSGKVKPSHVLAAMGVGDDLSRCALRASFGWNSAEADVDAALSSITRLLARVRARAA
ncbi:MAG: cysteine desulfurase [Alphaproteobacteria bacterium]|nr:cysteine desulfurase [Alphaproteobacteria bacterium]MDE2631252.1 cysteine desulfurase [Alphaproteobacteria bacterium]